LAETTDIWITMHIQQLRINHYKTVEEPIVIDHFSHVQILIGPNNSGKTNVLDAIEQFFNPAPDPDRFYDSRADLELTLRLKSGEYISIKQHKNIQQWLIDGKKMQKNASAVVRIQRRVIRIGSATTDALKVAQELKQFSNTHPAVYAEFCAMLKEYFNDIEISDRLFLANVFSDRKDRPIDRMGEGFKRLFVMLFYLYHPDYDIVLIDEPETHLHPTLIKKFVQVLKDKKLSNQIFLTTHSAVFVQPEHIAHIWRVSRDESRNTKIYQLAGSRIALDPNRLEQELDADNSEMFFADKVLLVEGVSDRILMRGLIDRFYDGDLDIKVIFANSKDNIDIYAKVFEAFQIPYMIMLDGDALRTHWSDVIAQALYGNERVSRGRKIQLLRRSNIFILDGDLERSYPRKYQRRDDKKPINALRAARQITLLDLESREMRVIKIILESV